MNPFVAASFSLVGADTIVLLLIVVLVGFPLWMIGDCLNNESKESNHKLIWLLVIILAPLLGPLTYLFARKLSRPSFPPSRR